MKFFSPTPGVSSSRRSWPPPACPRCPPPPRAPGPPSRSRSSCRSRPAAPPTSWRARSRRSCPRRSASSSSWTTAPAPAAMSAPTSWPSRRADGYTLLMGTVGTHGINRALVREAALRPDQGLRADHAGGRRAQRDGDADARRPAAWASTRVADFIKYAKAQSGQAQHGVQRQRHVHPPGRRAVQEHDAAPTWSTSRTAAPARRCWTWWAAPWT